MKGTVETVRAHLSGAEVLDDGDLVTCHEGEDPTDPLNSEEKKKKKEP